MLKQIIAQFDINRQSWPIRGLLALSLIAVIVSSWFLVNSDQVAAANLAAQTEALRPADLSLVEIKPDDCSQCFKLDALLSQIKGQNINLVDDRSLAQSSPVAQALITKYKIERLPSLVVQGELDKEPTLAQLWDDLGDRVVDDTFVLRRSGNPYWEVANQRLAGVMKVVMIKDSTCADCYDVTKHHAILASMGWSGEPETVLDQVSPEAQRLIKKYGITLLPTIVLSGDVNDYPALQQIWSAVGTTEKDGTLVFRQGEKQMGIYHDLAHNKIINPNEKIDNNQ